LAKDVERMSLKIDVIH